MATTGLTVLSEDGKTKTSFKSLPPMKPLRETLIDYASKRGIKKTSSSSSSSSGSDAMMLEFRLEKVDARKKVSYVKLDMDAPLRHLNLPANAKLKVFSVNEAETNRVADGNGQPKATAKQQQQQQPLPVGNRGAFASGTAGAPTTTGATMETRDTNEEEEEEEEEEEKKRMNDATSTASSVLGKRVARVVRQKTLDAEAEERNLKATMDPSTGLVSAYETLPDTFFKLSSAEAAQIVASNRRKLENGNVLLTKKHREQEAQKRRDKVQHATIRIMFQQKPISDVCVEAVFDAHTETIADVYTFVQEILSKDNKNEVNFELFVAPPKRVLKRNGQEANHSLYDAGLAPAAKVFFSSLSDLPSLDEEDTVLSAKCLEMLRLHDASSSSSKPVRPPPSAESEHKEEHERHFPRATTPGAKMTDRAKKSFVPKWFKK